MRAFRSNRFIALNDGSTINNIQIVVDFENFDEEIIKNIKTASSLKITGEVVESEGKGQDIEIIAKKLQFLAIISLKKWKNRSSAKETFTWSSSWAGASKIQNQSFRSGFQSEKCGKFCDSPVL